MAFCFYKFSDDTILGKVYRIITDREKLQNSNCVEFEKIMSVIVDYAEKHGFRGDIWKKYLIYMIICDENTFSLSCEWGSSTKNSIFSISLNDFNKLIKLYNIDWEFLNNKDEVPWGTILKTYNSGKRSGILPKSALDNIDELKNSLDKASTASEFAEIIVNFYRQFGSGKFAFYSAFRIDEQKTNFEIEPISNITLFEMSDLVGYERQKNQIVENTENFLNGFPASNILLFGDSGTGKSSSVKAVLKMFYPKGLRMIEVKKNQFKYLTNIIRETKNRNYKFIIYMDDLSFEENETDYKYLKTIIEGGLENKPDNTIIYATSNRRNLIKEKWSDRNEDIADVHSLDTMQEKLSLVRRFGLRVYYPAPSKNEFSEIVLNLAKRSSIDMSNEEVLEKAYRWETRVGSFSGRTAQQFIDNLKTKL